MSNILLLTYQSFDCSLEIDRLDAEMQKTRRKLFAIDRSLEKALRSVEDAVGNGCKVNSKMENILNYPENEKHIEHLVQTNFLEKDDNSLKRERMKGIMDSFESSRRLLYMRHENREERLRCVEDTLKFLTKATHSKSSFAV